MKKIILKSTHYYQKAKELPLKELVPKIFKFLLRFLNTKYTSTVDHLFSTFSVKIGHEHYSKIQPALIIKKFNPEYKSNNLDAVGLYLDHYFDLLGSGWIKNIKKRSAQYNKSNHNDVASIHSLLNREYESIDWHLDFKSGFQWHENTYYKKIEYGQKGVDIKVPWELARMQHLPQMAIAYGYCQENKKSELSNKIQQEFRNQVLDFIGSNPPRFGVNWRCTMDVGIRVANWLLGYNILQSFGAKFDKDFEFIFSRSIYEHGKHCVSNLEYSPKLRSNHYLSDIVGLLFASTYLPRSDETDCWLAFSAQEIVSEMEHEFHRDGSNFEASTAYHRLSTELILWGSLLILNLPEQKRNALKEYHPNKLKVFPKLKGLNEQQFNPSSLAILPDWFWNRLEKAIEFTSDITKPNGTIHQVGDNDSGRLFKVEPVFKKLSSTEAKNIYANLQNYNENFASYLDEDVLDHNHLLSIGSILFNRDEWKQYENLCPVESTLVRSFNLHQPPSLAISEQYASHQCKIQNSYDNLDRDNSEKVILLDEPALSDGLITFAYPDFGIYAWRSHSLYLAIRCGSVGQNGNGGHAHNDQLSVELYWKGKNIYTDPGTFLYTPHPDQRYLFRSVKSHCVPEPLLEREPNDITKIFGMAQMSTASVIVFNENKACFRFLQGDREVIFKVKIEGTRIISNYHINPSSSFSPGYGKLLNSNV